MTSIYPLRLATGSHKAGTGKWCAMNVESWINGDQRITDFPDCADRFLARVVQRVNDNYCIHRDGDLLCAPCSVEVLALAGRTRGTGGLPMAVVLDAYVTIAREEAEYVAKYADSAAEYVAEYAKYVAEYAKYADSAAEYVGDSAVDSVAKYVDSVAKYVDSVAKYADSVAKYADSAADSAISMRRARRIIDRFYELTGLVEHEIDDSPALDEVIPKMLRVGQ